MTRVHLFFNQTSRWYYPLHWSLLIFLGLAIYSQTFSFNFVFDDLDFIVKNPYIKRFDLVPEMWKTYPQTRTVGFYSFAFNYAINQLHPYGYHVFNFIIHLFAVGLVWAITGILCRRAPLHLSSDRLKQEIPFIIAVLFLVHPCQTQAITYISQRFESMATVFYLGSVYCYLCGRISSLRMQQTVLYAASMGIAILGILTKETAATIPIMILAIELIFFKSHRWRIFMLIGGGVVFLMLFIRWVGTDLNLFVNVDPIVSQSHDGDMITVKEYLLTQFRVFLTFMRLLIMPIHQNLDYDYALSKGLLQPPLTLVGMCLMGTMIIACLKLRAKYPLIAFGIAWVLITFAINVAPRANVIFEHKLYLISFGFLLIAVGILCNTIRQPMLLVKIFIMIIGTLSIVTVLRNQVWRNELTLWKDTVVQSPHKIRPHINLGSAYDRQGQWQEALFHYNQAISIDPKSSEAYYGRGNVHSAQGDFRQAVSDYNQAIIIKPDYAAAYYNRGNAYIKQGLLAEALLSYDKTIELNPHSPEVYNSRGNIYAHQGNLTQALSNYNKAIEIYPSYADGYYNRALFYGQQGNLQQAISDLNKAIDLKPRDADMYYNRGFAYYQLKEYSKALRDLRRVEELGKTVDPSLIVVIQEAMSH